MRRLSDLLLTTEPVQRIRLSQALLAMALMAAGVVAMHYFVWVGVAPQAAVWWWTVLSFAGIVAAYGLIRSGWSRRMPDPSLVLPQMLYAITSGAIAYAIVGAGRGGVFPIVMVILMFGLFAATPRQMRWVSVYAVALFGAVMALMSWRRPGVYVPEVELGHFIMVATMMPAVSLLAGRLSQMRHRMRQQRVELKTALARIQELATRDALTGLINRRHMQELLEQERQRSVRSGHVFCLAVIDVDRFKVLNAHHGHGAGDAVLCALAREALAAIRMSDILSRWGGAKFVLLLSDSRSALARGGVERLRDKVAAMRVPAAGVALGITVSAGLTEHRAGESVDDALERADRALYEAKAQGRDRVVVA